jgi:hypothetical protein
LLTYLPCLLLQTLIDLHGSDEGLGGKLTDDEIQIICGMYVGNAKWACHARQLVNLVAAASSAGQPCCAFCRSADNLCFISQVHLI